MLEDFDVDTPDTSPFWRDLSDSERITSISLFITNNPIYSNIEVHRASDLGQVYVSFIEPVPVSSRGILLLDFESDLKKNLDKGIFIWLEPIGDKNSLRNLRGIKVIP